jgi:hypothetical protein
MIRYMWKTSSYQKAKDILDYVIASENVKTTEVMTHKYNLDEYKLEI